MLLGFSIITKIKYNEWNKSYIFSYLRWVGYLDMETILWVRCGALLYRFLILVLFLALIIRVVLSVLRGSPKSLHTFI